MCGTEVECRSGWSNVPDETLIETLTIRALEEWPDKGAPEVNEYLLPVEWSHLHRVKAWE